LARWNNFTLWCCRDTDSIFYALLFWFMSRKMNIITYPTKEWAWTLTGPVKSCIFLVLILDHCEVYLEHLTWHNNLPQNPALTHLEGNNKNGKPFVCHFHIAGVRSVLLITICNKLPQLNPNHNCK
jgi:hypothetical protein